YLGAEAPALQTLGIDTHRPKRISGADDVRRNVLSNGACAANHAMSADADKLMDCGRSANYGPIADMYMSGQLYAIGDDSLVSYLAIMGNMDISHNPVIVADSGDADVLSGAGVNGDVFAHHVSVTDFQTCGFALVLFVLRHTANGTEAVEVVVFANSGVPVDYAVRAHHRTGANFYIRTNNSVRTNPHIGGQFGPGVD